MSCTVKGGLLSSHKPEAHDLLIKCIASPHFVCIFSKKCKSACQRKENKLSTIIRVFSCICCLFQRSFSNLFMFLILFWFLFLFLSSKWSRTTGGILNGCKMFNDLCHAEFKSSSVSTQTHSRDFLLLGSSSCWNAVMNFRNIQPWFSEFPF